MGVIKYNITVGEVLSWRSHTTGKLSTMINDQKRELNIVINERKEGSN